MNRGLLPFAVAAFLISAALASATTIIPRTLDELVSKAETIFVGEVDGVRSELEFSRDGRVIVTRVTFRVDLVLKGHLGLRTELTFLGGTVGDLRLEIAEMPQFKTGDRDVLFVSPTVRAVSPLVGFAYGRFRLVRDPATGADRVRTYDGRPIGAVAEIGRSLFPTHRFMRSMTYTEFDSMVRQRVAALGRR